MANILIIDNSACLTGASKSLGGFTRVLESKHNFFWAVTETIPDEELAAIVGNQPYERFAFIEISRSLSSNFQYLPRLCLNAARLSRLIKEKEISIVHVSDFYNMVGVPLKILNRNVKLVYHVRLLRTSYVRELYGYFIGIVKRFSDAIVCNSEAVSVDVGPADRKGVIYESQFFADPPDADTHLNPEVTNIAYVGHILPSKGQALAIQAFALVAREFPALKMRFIGKFDHNEASRRFKRHLDALIEKEGLRGRIEFTGLCPNIEAELEGYDILLNLSESESFSMVCLDALKAGVPLVASDCGGPAELFEHMKSGWLVPNTDYLAAAEAIRKLVSDYELRKRFSVEGKKYVFERFNVVENARKLDLLYDSVLNGKL